jgi:hypothetical protein
MPPPQASGLIALAKDTVTSLRSIEGDHENVDEIGDLPAFRGVTEKAELAIRSLEITKQHIPGFDGNTCQAMKQIMRGCNEKATRLETIFDQVLSSGDIPSSQRYPMVVRELSKENQVEARNLVEVLMIGILEDIRSLARNDAIRTVVEARELATAINELKAMSPSLSMARGDGTPYNFYNYGTGAQNVNSGNGPQYNNNDKGNQYIAQHQTFSHS